MKKITILMATLLFGSTSYAAIPYCKGTEVSGSLDVALQYVVTTFAKENGCKIGDNCLLNYDKVKYSIAWSESCDASERKGNDPLGSTFICKHGTCFPYGFSAPRHSY